MTPTDRFRQLYLLENESLAGPDSLGQLGSADQPECVEYAPGAPWIRTTPYDRLGIALSGGGIRIATFGLGLLQGLDRLEVLERCDYLSTVSGGGYIGGWWSAWLARRTVEGRAFPRPGCETQRAAVHRLRQFSNYLAPRRGLLEIDRWLTISAYLRGLCGSLLLAVAALAAALEAWRAATWLLMAAGPWTAPAALAACLLLAMGWDRIAPRNARRGPARDGFSVWERAIARCTALGVWWCMFAVNWTVSGWLVECDFPRWLFATAILGCGGVSGGLIRVLATVTRTAMRRRDAVLRWPALTLRCAAHATIFLTVTQVGAGIRALELAAPVWALPAALGVYGGLLAVATVVRRKPPGGSLHEVLRRRIAHAYLHGAEQTDSAILARPPCSGGGDRGAPAGDGPISAERELSNREFDDPPLRRLASRPLHLICCAASDLDSRGAVQRLRGAQSCVLSKWGVCLRGAWARQPRLRLSDALAASAAAASPCMGDYAARLGPAVSFVIAALNLRLGLWVRNPEFSRTASISRLAAVLREHFGRTDVSSGWMLLTDGGHFENLGLYELLRRHCRRIIVADCGSDPHYEFADLGNAIRRAREDFGIEVELDLSPLRPDAQGHARQHVAWGLIRYASANREDVGDLLVIKPTLTGDEPADVLAYRAAGPRFPQQSTSDQFFDEAQWESYRALGEHAARSAADWCARLEPRRSPRPSFARAA